MIEQLFSLDGRVALVTGGNGGLGRAMALALRGVGARVAVTGRNPAKNAAIAQELGEGSAVFTLDVRDEQGVAQTVEQVCERFGAIDILVNNAGMTTVGSILEMPKERWSEVIDIHLTGAFLCAREAARAMVAQGRGGKIINIGSMYSLQGPPNIAHYAAAKTGILGLTRALAVELAPHAIQVNALLPGWVETDLNRERLRTALGDHIRRKTPARRLGLAEDLAGAAIFLASHASDFVTGIALPVDGGYSIADRYWQDG